MAAKLGLIFIVAFITFQALSFETEASIVRRDTPATTPKNDIEDALNSIKQGFEEFVSKVQKSEVYQNASKLLDEFSQKVKQQGEELVQKIKDDTTTKN